jgi:hypothetical protein
MSEPYKIYTLHDPDTMAVRYVGFTSKTLNQRLVRHIQEARCDWSKSSRKINWLRSIISCGKRPNVLLVETVSEEIWQERERFWILHFRGIGCDLTNSCDGGDGLINPSDEVRAKIRAAHLGKTPSAETRAKIGAAHRGRIISEETKAKVSASLRGRVLSAETRAKLSASGRGKVPSEETREKLRAAKLGKTHTSESRAKMSAALRGRKLSKEHCLKVSAALIGRPRSAQHKAKLLEANSRPVIELKTGRVFPSVKDAALEFGVAPTTAGYWVKIGKFAYANNQPKEVIMK